MMRVSGFSILIILTVLFFSATLRAQSVGGVTSGGGTFCGSANSGFISVSGFVGTITGWQSSTNGGASWTNIPNVTASQSYNALTQTTCYRAIVQQGAFPADTSTVSCIVIVPPSNGGTLSGGGTFCGGSGAVALTLSGNVGSVLNWQFSTDGGATWTVVNDTNTTLNLPNVTQNTLFEAVVQNTTFCNADTSSQSGFTIVPQTVAGSVSASDTVCYQTNAGLINLTGNVGSVITWVGSVDNGITWISLGTTTATFPYSGLTQTTQLAAVVQNATCNIDTTAPVTITVLSPVVANAGTDVTISQFQSTTLTGTGSGSPVWSPAGSLSSSTAFTTTASPTVTTTYTLTVTDTFGCVGTDEVIVNVNTPQYQGMITSLFTPNGDGINDTWFIQDAALYPDNEVFVYNIYGNEVFSAVGYKNDWKGTYSGQTLPDGTYFYVVKMNSSSEVMQGTLEIMSGK